MTATRKINVAQSRELLRHTPMKTEGYNARHEREDAHRALPQGRQPFMVCFMGIFDYGVMWIGEAGPRGETRRDRKERELVAQREMEWWQDKIVHGLEILPFSRRPSPNDLMIRQQWDLDALVDAIQRGYERD